MVLIFLDIVKEGKNVDFLLVLCKFIELLFKLFFEVDCILGGLRMMICVGFVILVIKFLISICLRNFYIIIYLKFDFI